MDYKRIQEKLDTKKMPLVFAKDRVVNSLADVIWELFFARRVFQTYHKRKDGYLQKQRTGPARTIQDCYLLAKEYLPGISYSTVVKAVELLYYHGYNNLDKVEPKYRLNHNYCPNVARVVHSLYVYGSKVTKLEMNELLDKFELNVYKNEAVQID